MRCAHGWRILEMVTATTYSIQSAPEFSTRTMIAMITATITATTATVIAILGSGPVLFLTDRQNQTTTAVATNVASSAGIA